MSPAYFIGMISGTSRDGADAALVSFESEQPEVKCAVCIPYPADLALDLDQLIRSGRRPGESDCRKLNVRLAVHFSSAAGQLLEEAGVDQRQVKGIGSHGQTVWHDPDGPYPESIQLGDPRQIARQTGIITVGDFRKADIEAGGQGAPLAPLLHLDLFRPGSRSGRRIVLNLGGIANISVLGGDGTVSGHDTGPANCLMDAWTSEHKGEPFDTGGRWAALGEPDPGLLNKLLTDPYFKRSAPKSTGVEYFNLGWLSSFLSGREVAASDVQATLAELTAVSVARAVLPYGPEDVLVCGGGSHNRHLLSRLQAHLPATPVKSTADFGLDPDWIEAVLFAWLARERLARRKLDTRLITGATRKVLLGEVAQPG